MTTVESEQGTVEIVRPRDLVDELNGRLAHASREGNDSEFAAAMTTLHSFALMDNVEFDRRRERESWTDARHATIERIAERERRRAEKPPEPDPEDAPSLAVSGVLSMTRSDIAHRKLARATDRIRRAEAELLRSFVDLDEAVTEMAVECGIQVGVTLEAPVEKAWRVWKDNGGNGLDKGVH